MSKRELHWKPIEEAPEKQELLIWDRHGKFHKGTVSRPAVGGHDVRDNDGFFLFSATHYAVVEGP